MGNRLRFLLSSSAAPAVLAGRASLQKRWRLLPAVFRIGDVLAHAGLAYRQGAGQAGRGRVLPLPGRVLEWRHGDGGAGAGLGAGAAPDALACADDAVLGISGARWAYVQAQTVLGTQVQGPYRTLFCGSASLFYFFKLPCGRLARRAQRRSLVPQADKAAHRTWPDRGARQEGPALLGRHAKKSFDMRPYRSSDGLGERI